MRVITQKRLKVWGKKFPMAHKPLMVWHDAMLEGGWQNLDELGNDFPSADEVIVKSGRRVLIFNIGGKKYRLIAAVHYDKQRVYAMRFMTHAEYNKDLWKGQL